jgi:succinate dehydrogenase / fumarate reductase cytochrome b subunit
VANQQSFLDKHHFLLRRLHSLTGIVPIGVFLIAHLVTNSSLAWGAFALRGEPTKEPGVLPGGAQYFQEEVLWINSEIPHLFLIEITLWLAIGFHSVLGVYYATTGKRNTKNYAYQDNWRYTLQRISGYLGILFIFYHIATLRWQWTSSCRAARPGATTSAPRPSRPR